MKQLNNEIIKVLKYFSFFAYHPTEKEIYTFLPIKIDKNKLKYTPPQYSIPTSTRLRGASKYQISKRKLKSWKFRAYIRLISLFPQIKLIGLSGSISMMNAEENDDVDLFIITAKKRLFTGRFIALVLAQLLGLRRSRKTQSSNNKICLNLFFDEKNLKVPKFKQTEFVGHEVLQMKPIIVKGDIYKRFLEANAWVFKLFPNASHVIPVPIRGQAPAGIQTFLDPLLRGDDNLVESILRKIQLLLINRHRTTEIITSTQLWFHPDDFEKKIKY